MAQNISGWPASAQLAYRTAIAQGATPQQATDFAAAQYGESGFNPNAVNKSSGAAGLYQLLSPGYVNKANAMGGVFNPQANINAILPDYLSYYKQHPQLVPGAAAAAVERSGEGADYYAQGNQRLGGTAPVTATLASSQPQPRQVQAAQQQIGVPYSWGGGTPAGPSTGFGRGASTKGFDCSSLVQYAFAKTGVKLPRTTYEQFKVGQPVAKNQLRPGDAVFFTGSDPMNGLPGHVGLYVGGGRYIQAPHTGASVEVSNLSDRSDFVGGRRYAGGAAPAAAAQTAVAKLGAPAQPQTVAQAPAGPRKLPQAVLQALQILRS